MRTFNFQTPDNLLSQLGTQIRATRLHQNVTQNELALRVGASLSSIRRIESTGQGTLTLLANVSIALNVSEGFSQIFRTPEPSSIAQLEAAHERLQRRRARSVSPDKNQP